VLLYNDAWQEPATTSYNYYQLNQRKVDSVHWLNKSSAVAEMAHVFLVNHYYGIVENPMLDTNNVDFCGTTALWCSTLNPVAVPNHESKERRYGTLA